jgi:arylsulfatase A-like enzyme
MKSAIVVVIDRLGAGFLGPYGNTWLDTPHFNRLASQSLLCESALTDSPELPQVYRAWWMGRHALEPPTDSRAALPQAARDAGLATILITDEPQLAELPAAAALAETIVVPGERVARSARELDQTALGRLLATANERLQGLASPALVWIHSRGMAGPWDAPLALRQQFADEDDPEPPDFVEPPDRVLPADFDPDELLGIVHAYAGQVALVDLCLGMLLDALDQSPRLREALLVVTSPRGYPLGEHRRIGGDCLYGELLHVPLFVRLPDFAGALARTHKLIQPCDLVATLRDWLALPADNRPGLRQSLLSIVSGQLTPTRPLAVAKSLDQRAIRSPAWFLRESIVEGQTSRELFAKPDDRWEVNEVASRCGDVAEQLAAAADQFEQAAAAGTLASLPPLAEILTDSRR